MEAMTKEISDKGISHKPLSTLDRIEDLSFVKDRQSLLSKSPTEEEDRTVEIVRRWHNLGAQLQIARRETMTCCEARPGKGDLAVLAVVDRAKFDGYQGVIKEHEQQIAVLENAIRELDEIDAPHLIQLRHQLGGARSNRANAQKMYQNWLGDAIKSFPSIDAAKANEAVVQREKALAEAKAAEDKAVKEISPKIEQITSILEAVGC